MKRKRSLKDKKDLRGLSWFFMFASCVTAFACERATSPQEKSVKWTLNDKQKEEFRCIRPLSEVEATPRLKASHCPSDPEGAPPMVAVRRILVHETQSYVNAEVVSTPAETQRGLMYRTHMEDDRGMLFVMDRKVHSFWMHNTCIPLDMFFVDDDGTINGILENVPVLNDDERSVGCPGTYVLEVNAGWARRHGVKPGMKLDIPPGISMSK